MLTKQEAKNKDIPQNFISNVRVLEGDNVVYNATLTPYLAKRPLLKFNYYGGNASILRLETIDNNKKLTKQDSIIERINSSQEISTIKKVEDSNQTIKLSSRAIQNQFGNSSLIESGNIKILLPKTIIAPSSVLIKIQSNIKAKSVTLFTTQVNHKTRYFDMKYIFNDNDLTLVYQYFVQEKSIIDFGVKVKLFYGENSKVLVVVEAEDGKLYMAEEKSIDLNICSGMTHIN